MKVLFIYSLTVIESETKPLNGPGQMQLGISYISSLLKAHGHKTRLVVLSRVSGRKNRKIIDECLRKFCPKLICFTAVSTEYPFIADVARYVKNHYPDIYLLIGGPHVSLNPNDALLEDFDALCIGEGEYPVLELVSQLKKNVHPSGIPNLWIKNKSGIEKNEPRAFLQDLDSLPFPDREMWNEWIGKREESRYAVLLGRGCPYQCSYCCNHVFAKLAAGTYTRFRSPDSIVDEIRQLITKHPGQNEIFLEAENLDANRVWAMEFCLKLERFNRTLSPPLSFGANLRIMPEADLEDLFAACKKANISYLHIGLESGSERIRRQILRRSYSNEDVINAVALARKHGLRVGLFVMIGLPSETMADFWQTVKIARSCSPDWNLVSIFFPYPGTDAYLLCNDEGWLRTPVDTEMERKKCVLDLPGFTKKQVEKSYTWFDYYVCRGRKPVYKLLARVLETKLDSSPYVYIVLTGMSRVPFLDWFRNAFLHFRNIITQH